MGKKGRIVALIGQLACTVLLFESLESSYLEAFIGPEYSIIGKLLLTLGTVIITILSVAIGLLMPSRRDRILRDGQIHVFKYFGTVGIFQLIMMAIGYGEMNHLIQGIAHIGTVVKPTLLIMYIAAVIQTPLTYFRHLIGELKSAEVRNPMKIVSNLKKY